MFMILSEAGRTKDFTVQIKSPSGGYVIIQSADVVRVKIGRVGSVELDLDEVATNNGSVVSKTELGDGAATHAAVNLRLGQGDTTNLSGPYVMEVNLVDNSDGDRIKAVEYGLINFVNSQNGDVGQT